LSSVFQCGVCLHSPSVVALLVFSLGAGVSMFEGVQHLRQPNEIESPFVNYVVLVLSLLFEGGSWAIAVKEFRAKKGGRGYLEAVELGKDPTTFAVLLEDSAALIGLVVALVGVTLSRLTGNPLYDGAASIVIGLILAGTALLLAKETKGLLIGESANQEVVEGIRKLIQQIPEVDKVNEILTMHIGPDFVLVNISLMISAATERARVHEVFDYIDERIKARYPIIQRVFIESETAIGRKPGHAASGGAPGTG